MLRVLLLAAAAAALAAGLYLLIAVSSIRPAGIELAAIGAVVIVGLLFERHYRTRARPGATLQSTGERFIDPVSGKLVQVRYDPQTGERVYEDTDRPH